MDGEPERVDHYGQYTLLGVELVNACDGEPYIPAPGAPTCPRCQAAFRAQLERHGLKREK